MDNCCPVRPAPPQRGSADACKPPSRRRGGVPPVHRANPPLQRANPPRRREKTPPPTPAVLTAAEPPLRRVPTRPQRDGAPSNNRAAEGERLCREGTPSTARHHRGVCRQGGVPYRRGRFAPPRSGESQTPRLMRVTDREKIKPASAGIKKPPRVGRLVLCF